ncbi:Transglutaminase-like enzyme, putative cysteine protease [Verrucomicrobium sp. GAS474]|uniref:transglutaminase family protein n=1 Tax=Verrucomicrobium sp. GAS474 TaxID=1882831 RepID=UPI00087A3571|nr:transglutaminase family protein [Verrucomicrobium sp. GAS474]SDU04887.1 Transglutaminase-like enzyme, putative cysteine protease [Verrucomicrobium sp. GAS474]
MQLHIHHRTTYQYASPVAFGPHRLLVRPRESHGLRIVKSSIRLSPSHRFRWMRDPQENNVGLVDFTQSSTELVVDSECTVDSADRNPFDFVIPPEAVEYPFSYEPELLAELLPLSLNLYARDGNRIGRWLHPFWHPGKRTETLPLLQRINTAIFTTFTYRRRMEKGVQSPAETIENNSGSCRDFATLFVETCRFLGLAARFVSGYMHSAEIEGRMSMHGWAEVYLPGAGWIGFDPSWGLLASAQYVPVAVSRHPEHVPPISGTYFGTQRDFVRSTVDLYVTEIASPSPLSF